MSKAWYEGSSNPLDQAVDLGPGNNFADWLPGTGPSPEQVLIRCEEQDQAERCACGTHLREHYRRTSDQSQIKEKTQ